MQALATRFHDQIKTHALDKGARYVVVVNVPAVTSTPRFRAVLAGIAAANGGGATGAAAAAGAETLFKNWAVAFNNELSTRFNGNASVLLIDLYGSLNDFVARPAVYGLTNVVNTACPATGVGGDGLPSYDFPTCTATALSAAAPPAGATGGAGWWRTYLFSDGFHPTPYVHSMTANQIRSALFNRSWQ
jgi:phospholipase/lecithinase/hemolysin